MQHLAYKTLDDFYKISVDDVIQFGGIALLKHVFGGSLGKALQSVYPDHIWFPWKFEQNLSRGFWDKQKNQKDFMDWLGKELGFNQMDDWYNINHERILERGGAGLLNKYKSRFRLLESIYPDHLWVANRFMVVSKIDRQYVNQLGKELGLKRMEDWYSITVKDIQSKCGQYILDKYNRSPSILLQSVYPNHKWILHQFERVPKGHWDVKENQREFMNWLGKELGFEQMDDWYKLSLKEIQEKGGSTLAVKYENSPSKLMQSVYPQHPWILHKFRVTKGYWDKKENQEQFMAWMGKELGVKQMEDWYKVTMKDIREKGGNSLLFKYGTLFHLFSSIYPQHGWNKGWLSWKTKW